jgi:hypothetical protein
MSGVRKPIVSTFFLISKTARLPLRLKPPTQCVPGLFQGMTLTTDLPLTLTLKPSGSVPNHAMKAYRGIQVQFYSFLTTRPGTFTPGKEPRYPLKRLGGPHSRFGHFGEYKIPVRSVVAIPTMLIRLPSYNSNPFLPSWSGEGHIYVYKTKIMTSGERTRFLEHPSR